MAGPADGKPDTPAQQTQRPSTFLSSEIREIATEALNVLETQPDKLAVDNKNTATISQFQPDDLKGATISPGANKVAFQRDIGPAIDAAILALDSLEMEAPASTLRGVAPPAQGAVKPPEQKAPETLRGVAPPAEGSVGPQTIRGVAPPAAGAVAPPEQKAPETIRGVAPPAAGAVTPPEQKAPETLRGIAPQGMGGIAPPKEESPITLRGVAPQGGVSHSSFMTGAPPKAEAPVAAKPAEPRKQAPARNATAPSGP
jgi:hypothetical protein